MVEYGPMSSRPKINAWETFYMGKLNECYAKKHTEPVG